MDDEGPPEARPFATTIHAQPGSVYLYFAYFASRSGRR